METELQKRISIVVPVYNEGAHIRESMACVGKICEDASILYELVLVDDGSKDNSWEVISAMAKEDERITAVRLSRNFGKEPALCAGLVLCTASLFLVFVPGHMEIKQLFDGISFISEQFGVLIPVFLVMLLFSMMYQMLLYYLSIAVGQLFGTYKILASVIAYCAISFALEIVLLVIMLCVFAGVGFDKVNTFMNSMDGMTNFYYISSGWTIVLGIVEYFVICRLLKKKLNLV